MSRFNIDKKLSPAKNAWKRFTSSVQKKLHKLKRSKAIKKTTERFSTTLGTVLGRSPSFARKEKKLSRPSSALRVGRNKHHIRPSYKPVYVDELFMQHVMVQQMTNKGHKKTKPSHIIDPGFSSVVCNFSSINKKESKLLNQASVSESSKKKEMDIEKVTNGEVGCSSTVTQLRGVDERAEEFITRFKEEMRRQRQRSFGEFEEMLARSA